MHNRKEAGIILDMLVHDKGLKLYGNRHFFKVLAEHCLRLSECPDEGYCEFQTVALNAKGYGISVVPKIRVSRVDSETMDLRKRETIDPCDFDVVFMAVEDSDLDF